MNTQVTHQVWLTDETGEELTLNVRYVVPSGDSTESHWRAIVAAAVTTIINADGITPDTAWINEIKDLRTGESFQPKLEDQHEMYRH